MKGRRNYYNTHLNLSHTLELPSNLLSSQKRNLVSLTPSPAADTPLPNFDEPPPIQRQSLPAEELEMFAPALPPKQEGGVVYVEQKRRTRKNVLYKRLNSIKNHNDQLNKYSYSKLLSKMVVMGGTDPVDQPTPQQQIERGYRTVSDYSCLKSRLVSMDYHPRASIESNSHQKDGKSKSSKWRGEPDPNRTAKAFRRLYMPGSDKATAGVEEGGRGDQKYIYINGRKTECRRIHNFTHSESFKSTYDRAFAKTNTGFYSRNSRYQ